MTEKKKLLDKTFTLRDILKKPVEAIKRIHHDPNDPWDCKVRQQKLRIKALRLEEKREKEAAKLRKALRKLEGSIQELKSEEGQ